ncbi:MAG TPA: glycine--tRNA ligase subunit beta [Myxococcales bacterium]|nr:glycine--tRNA ligase subunit beta [Myxococcales bacterium]
MDLVFEIGTEELPASFQRPALDWMAAEINKGLDDARLNGEGEGQRANISTYATPRRLALIVTAIAARAPDVRKKLSGPPLKQAQQDGKWTKAAEGFARKAGVALDALRIEGDRVVVEQEVRGQTAAEALPPLLEQIVRGIPFRKSMRWDSLEADAFARPVHWIAAALDGKPLAVRFADVVSAPSTRGHRFAAPAEFPLPSAGAYLEALRKAHVVADWAERRKRIEQEVARAAREAGGVPRPDDELLETVTGLVEEPSAVAGSFDEQFLQLPPEVLVSEMRGHQKYFAVQDGEGRLLPAFVAVSNTRVRDPAVSRRGYERVLRARLSDGKFFFDEDRKLPLRARVEKLGRRTFVQGLGSELDRSGRLRELSLWLHGATGKGNPAALAEAAELCKADLTTGMVGEFPELQGTMGRVYALHDGVQAEVADAIFEHYLPRGAEERLPSGDAGALLGMADRLDLLVGLFGLGKEPSGTADPYGLRRAALGLLRVTLARGYRFEMDEALRAAGKLHGRDDAAVREKVWQFLLGRLEVLLREKGQPDSIQAALHTGARDLVSLEKRLVALQTVREKNRAQFEATAAAFRRIGNILLQAQEKAFAEVGFHADLCKLPAEQALAKALETCRGRVSAALEEEDEDYLSAYATLAELRPVTDRFFDEVMVMDPDPSQRDNRLALLRSLHELFAPLADFSRLQVDKTA